MDEAATVTVDGRAVAVPDDHRSLLDLLRHDLGITSVKDGCSPQGQCGCCTVLVDGAPRVACVTPARRVAGRHVTTLGGLDRDRQRVWGDAFCAAGGSQCGFCTPGIIVRLESLAQRGVAPGDHTTLHRALAAHLCRCTGWRTVIDAYEAMAGAGPANAVRDLDDASRRATVEGRTPQRVSPGVALGHGGFADDTAPADSLVAVPDGSGGWTVAETLVEARAASGKVQGRRTTATAEPPLHPPDGDWAATLRTSWVEPGYLETDASWCAPGGEPASPLANGGAFGAKSTSPAPAAARRLADLHGRPVRVLLSREDTVRMGPKRPPVAGGARGDGSGAIRVVRTPGISAAIASYAPDLVVTEVAVAGPPTSTGLRAVGWAEATVLLAGAAGTTRPVRSPDGAIAEAEITSAGVRVRVACGDPLDDVVLRSYCVGAAHMALGWAGSESLAVEHDGTVDDLTIRSFGILRSVDTPPVEVEIERGDGPPVNGSDAVFAAVAAVAWLNQGCPPVWPSREPIHG